MVIQSLPEVVILTWLWAFSAHERRALIHRFRWIYDPCRTDGCQAYDHLWTRLIYSKLQRWISFLIGQWFAGPTTFVEASITMDTHRPNDSPLLVSFVSFSFSHPHQCWQILCREMKNRGPYDHCRSLLFHSSSASPPSFWPYDYSRSWFASSPSQSDHYPDAVQGTIIAWHSRYCFESTTFVGLSCHPIIIRY